jgi:hypothetical protein
MDVQQELNLMIDKNAEYLKNFKKKEPYLDRNEIIRGLPKYSYTNVPTSALGEWAIICNCLSDYEKDPEGLHAKECVRLAGYLLTMLMISPEREYGTHRTLGDECAIKVRWMWENMPRSEVRRALHVIHRETLAEIDASEAAAVEAE